MARRTRAAAAEDIARSGVRAVEEGSVAVGTGVPARAALLPKITTQAPE